MGRDRRRSLIAIDDGDRGAAWEFIQTPTLMSALMLKMFSSSLRKLVQNDCRAFV